MSGVYDLVVIGGGTAGLVSAVGAAGLGARVALIERGQLGGDCLVSGCVPSKTLLASAKSGEHVRRAGGFGIRANAAVDFRAVMARLAARRATIGVHDSAERLQTLGVDVLAGQGTFSGPRSIEVDGRTLVFRRAVIATGARASVPDLPGLRDVPFLTNESVFSLTSLPASLAVLGAGPVGCELAQAFALLGSRVTLIERAPQVLPHDDADAAAVLAGRLVAAGVSLRTSARVERVTPGVRVSVDGDDILADQLLLAVGRQPNVEGLGLERAGVALGPHGVGVDDYLRTSNPRVFAAGDVCSSVRFTHAADAAARLVIRNALFFGRSRASAFTIPRAIYTVPEVAHVGVDVHALPPGAATITVRLAEVDRAIVDDEQDGFVRVHHVRGRLVGATVVSPHAGEVIGLLGLCVARGVTLGELSETIFPYPTIAEALRKAGDQYRRQALTPSRLAWLRRYHALMR